MRYFELIDDVHIQNRWHLGEVCAADGTTPRLRAGLPFSGAALRAVVFQSGDPLPFALSSFGVPIVQVAVAEAMARVAGQDVQRLPVEVLGGKGFEALNLLRVVDCFDQRRSEFVKWTAQDHRADLAGQYRMVTRLRLEPEAVPPDAHAFRIKGWVIAIIVSERVKEAMEEVGCLGAKFSPVT
jgi:hypothetical protein